MTPREPTSRRGPALRPGDRPAGGARPGRARRRAAVPARRHRHRRAPRHPPAGRPGGGRRGAHRGVQRLQLPRLLHDRRGRPPARRRATARRRRRASASTAAGSRSGSGVVLTVLGLALAPRDRRRDGRIGTTSPRTRSPTSASASSARPRCLLALAGTGYLRGMQDTSTTLVIAVAANGAEPRARARCSCTASTSGSRVRRGAPWSRSTAPRVAYLVDRRAHGAREGASVRPRPAGIRANARVGSRLVDAHRLAARRACSPPPPSRRGSATTRSPRTRSACRSSCSSHSSLDALAIAGQAMVGRFLGAADAARRARGRRAGCIELGVGRRRALRRRRRGPAPVAGGRCSPTTPASATSPCEVLWIVAALQPLAAVVFVLDGVLIGAGDAGYLALAMLVATRRRVPARGAARRRARRRPALALGRARAVDAGPLRGHGRPLPHHTAGRSPARRPRHDARTTACGRPRRDGVRWARCPRPTRRCASSTPSPTTRTPAGERQPVVPRRRDDDLLLDDDSRCDVDAWGRSERVRALARALYDPVYRYWLRAEWEGLEHVPLDGGALLVGQPRRRHPVGRTGGHARHRDRARCARSTASPRTSSAPCPSSAPCGRAPAACPRTPTTRTGCCTTTSSSCSCSPRAPRPPASSSATATSSDASGAAASSRSPCARAYPIVPHRDRRQRGGDADRLEERAAGQAAAASPTSPSPPTSSCTGRCSATWCRSRRSSASACSRRSPSTSSPGHARYNRGVVMEEAERIRALIQSEVDDLLRTRRSVWRG